MLFSLLTKAKSLARTLVMVLLLTGIGLITIGELIHHHKSSHVKVYGESSHTHLKESGCSFCGLIKHTGHHLLLLLSTFSLLALASVDWQFPVFILCYLFCYAALKSNKDPPLSRSYSLI